MANSSSPRLAAGLPVGTMDSRPVAMTDPWAPASAGMAKPGARSEPAPVKASTTKSFTVAGARLGFSCTVRSPFVVRIVAT